MLYHQDCNEIAVKTKNGGGAEEPEWESQRAIESQRETGRESVRAKENQSEL